MNRDQRNEYDWMLFLLNKYNFKQRIDKLN